MQSVISFLMKQLRLYGLCATIYVFTLWLMGTTQEVPKNILLMGLIIYVIWYLIEAGWRIYMAGKEKGEKSTSRK